jgi:hypothetical protein
MRKWTGWVRPLLLLVAAAAAGIAANVVLLGIASGASGDAVGHFKPRLESPAAANTAPAQRVSKSKGGPSKPRRSAILPRATTTPSTGAPTTPYDDHADPGAQRSEPADD